MNREYKAKTQSCFSVVGTSQTLALGGAPAVAVTTFTLSATPQKSVMLGVLNLVTEVDGMISDIKVAGQSVFCSDGSTPIQLFNQYAHAVSERYAGIALGAGLDVFVDGSLDTSGDVSLAWFVDPIEKAVDMSQQTEFYNYCFGLGTKSAAASTTETLQQVSTRPCTLGELVAYEKDGNNADIYITSIKVGGEELLTGAGDQKINLASFNADQPNIAGLDLNYRIGSNVPVAIKFENVHATLAREVRAGIYCRIG